MFELSRRRVAATIVVQFVVTFIFALAIMPFTGGWRRFAGNFLYGLVYAGCIGWLATLTMPYLGKRVARLPPAWGWAVMLGSMVPLAVVGSLLALALLAAFGMFPWSMYWPIFRASFQITVILTMVIGIGFSLYEGMHYRAQYETAQARLSSLESRLQPHFLFNTLNSISALIPDDPAAAERTTERLAALLRFSLDATHQSTVRLEHELKVTTDYLEIEKARFGDRLEYSLDVPPDLMQVAVPPFSLQTLVENSVKYGGGEIRVSAKNGDGRLLLTVWDSGSGFSQDAAIPPGHGLQNLRDRLSVLWGSRATLEFHRENLGTSVRVSIPATHQV